MKSYMVNEVFFSQQGEGARVGTDNVFVRFSACNLRCSRATHGFDCDTEFVSGARMTGDAIAEACEQVWMSSAEKWVILTGGEPLLQVDDLLVARLHAGGWRLALETNGTRPIPEGIDYVCVSPKVAEHAIAAQRADELRYVRGLGQALPKPRLKAKHLFISPAFDGDVVRQEVVEWCRKLCDKNPQWTVSIQMHKLWGVR